MRLVPTKQLAAVQMSPSVALIMNVKLARLARTLGSVCNRSQTCVEVNGVNSLLAQLLVATEHNSERIPSSPRLQTADLRVLRHITKSKLECALGVCVVMSAKAFLALPLQFA